ncbi:class I SAM-dependent DNA methyltransferase [Macrococcus equipercicus]|uniref:Class I SAM-dependent methyltransferase n=1 Tax=Macrococcus equipercicus TaxID=69967 RepID=A0A9Q9BRW6_9STAP|nr:class I SAM-dependent methyltransferase [Macrococcus equipercicus]KAA1040052.1 class I SAM-dependent methyltransferase [Macrococcus equipercicus]UTH12999.1 class I SAM-dependent methyltransferase [Macrococcus equipercicus]
MAYEAFAALYDRLMYDQPYDKWLAVTAPYLTDAKTVLDLGCGTGSFTTLLPTSLTRVGVDLSADMLAVAAQKDPSVNWLVQDITELDLGMTFDLITCYCDSLNYIAAADLPALFSRVKAHLAEKGTFLFDVHSQWKMAHLFDGQTYTDETEDVTYIWQTFAGEQADSVWHELSFFVRDDQGKYDRYDETHFQQTLSVPDYTRLLAEAELKAVRVFADFLPDEPVGNEPERLFFVVTHQ